MAKVKLGRMVALRNALSETRGQMIGKQAAKALYDLRTRVNSMQDFYMEQMQELVEKMGLQISPDMTVEFGNDAEKRQQFVDAVKEIEQIEFDIGEPIDLTEYDFNCSESFVEATDGIILL